VPGLGPHSRVLDVGAGTGCLVPHLTAAGVEDYLAVDVAPRMLSRLASDHGATTTTLGNEGGVRTWLGDVESVPPYEGQADAVFFNAVFGNVPDQRSALLAAALLLRPGGHIVVSHPLGRAWHAALAAADPVVVPHALPAAEGWPALLAGLPLRLASLVDDAECYIALLQVRAQRRVSGVGGEEATNDPCSPFFLFSHPPTIALPAQVPPHYALPPPPLTFSGPVVVGFGRGSREMGVPTANVDPGAARAALDGQPRGVYFG